MMDRYVLDDGYITHTDTAQYDKSIISIEHPLVALQAHNASPDKPSAIAVSFFLSSLDRENAAFIVKYAQKINEMLWTYTTIGYRFDGTISVDEIMKRDMLHVQCQIDTRTWKVSTSCKDNDSVGQLFFSYMKYFEAIQHLITIFNTFIITRPEDKVRHLNNTFAIIGCYRHLGHFDNYYDLHFRHGSDVLQTVDAETDFFSHANMPLGFEMFKKKLAKAYHMLCPEGDTPCKAVLRDVKEYATVNTLLHSYLWLAIRIRRLEDDATRYLFFVEDDAGKMHEFDDLSSGDKSLIFLITAMYGFDLQNGLIVIDEPELHLHPQLQKKLLSLIEEAGSDLQMQCIIATQSSLLINEHNIQYVHRFFLKDHATHVVAPLHGYHEHESNLVQILRFTNTAKIFFVNKIIMVEGEIDELFFGYYLWYLSTHDHDRAKKITNYEIININGKGAFTRWKKFLDKFWLQSYFIGDRDNIQETGVRVDMNQYKKHIEGIPKTKKYPTVIQLIQAMAPEKRKEIISFIEGMYKEDIFLLKQWDIETYMGLEEKGLEETIEFYHRTFSHWITDPAFAEKRKEMEMIFTQIFA